jgi:hypothetical protein
VLVAGETPGAVVPFFGFDGAGGRGVDRTPRIGPRDLYPCYRSTVMRVGGRVITWRSHAPYVSGEGSPANSSAAAVG